MSLSLIINPNQKKENSGSFCILMDGDQRVCNAEEWAFHSCGTMMFYNMSINPNWWTKANIDRVIQALPVLSTGKSSYKAQEVYLQISSGQLKNYFQAFLTHPNIKEVDVYTNKAHGPHKLHLFRISATKDFQ